MLPVSLRFPLLSVSLCLTFSHFLLFPLSFLPPTIGVLGWRPFFHIELTDCPDSDVVCERVCLHTCCSPRARCVADTLHTDELDEKRANAFNTLRVIDFLYTKHILYSVCVSVCVCAFLKNDSEAQLCIIHGCISPGLATLVQGNIAAVDACTHAHTHPHTHTRISFNNGFNKRIL